VREGGEPARGTWRRVDALGAPEAVEFQGRIELLATTATVDLAVRTASGAERIFIGVRPGDELEVR